MFGAEWDQFEALTQTPVNSFEPVFLKVPMVAIVEGETEAVTTSALWRADNANSAVPYLLGSAERVYRDKVARSAVFG
jgi:hypothetical protein